MRQYFKNTIKTDLIFFKEQIMLKNLKNLLYLK